MEKKKEKSGLAVVSLILGILAIGGSFIPIINNASIILGIIGLIIGLIPLFKKKSKGLAIAGVILSVLAVVISFALQDSWGKALDQTSKEIDKSLNDSDGTNTEEILKNDVDVKLGNLNISTDEYGLSESSLVVTVTNKASSKQSYEIQVEAVDASGNRIMDDYVYANNLAAGQTQEFKIFEYIEDDKIDAMKNATFNIFSVSKY